MLRYPYIVCLSLIPALLLTLDAFEGEKVWQRTLDPVTYGPQDGPNNDARFSGGRGSMNLALHDGHVAIVGEDLESPEERYYLTVLDAGSGRTRDSLGIRSDAGNSRSYRFPWSIVSASGDNVPGLVRIAWDAETGILFTGQGAYESAYTAYRPLEAGETNRGVAPPAYAFLNSAHEGAQDAFGRTAGDYWTTLGTARTRWAGKDADIWGLSATYCGEDYTNPDDNREKVKYDLDWQTLWGRQGSSYYNTSGVFSVQEEGPVIGLNKGAGWGHNQAGHFYLFNKYTGMKILGEKPEMPVNFEGVELRPFGSGGMKIGPERVFLMGPGEDRNGDGKLGDKRPEGVIPKVDQGLAIWAYELNPKDSFPADGLEGPAGIDTLDLELVFAHSVPSRYEEDPAVLESFGQSWYETDGFFRPKPMVVDGSGVWVSWKPSRAAGVELVYADAAGLQTIDLGVGQGMKGVDLWPKLAMAETDAGRRLVFATGNSRWRERVMPEDIDAFMEPFLLGRGTKVPYPEAEEKDKQRVRDRIQASGAWSPELSTPRGDAAIAVADPDSGELLWSDNLSARFPALPSNGFWTFIDRSQMTLVGDEAVFGFVDVSGEEATLVLARYDLGGTARPEPAVSRIPLGFSAQAYSGSALTDLREDSGIVYALITQGEVFTLRDPRWTAQHIVALR